ncbi:MAG: HD-GYP domain-containing protein [Ruminococcus sp.]|nr:HD-GYP domain-containing protein [Ruminococcus sp.]
MLLSCVLIMLFLRRVVIKPLSSVQLTLRNFMNDKDSAAAQEHLKTVTTKNEIGVLSGDVTALVREIDKYTEHIKKLSVEVMEALAHTIDAKDKYTNGHSFRVAMYSRMLAKELGLPAQEQDDIYYMGLLHDIGKIGIPGAIINKTSRLTDEEYEQIKMHPVYGYEILSEIESMPELSIGARYHHERIDGKGYPDGLKGDEIPYMARIISVADSYDTMTSNRSYRDYLPQDVVREEIEKNIGTQFDETAARAMLKIIKRDKDYMLHE